MYYHVKDLTIKSKSGGLQPNCLGLLWYAKKLIKETIMWKIQLPYEEMCAYLVICYYVFMQEKANWRIIQKAYR